MKNGKPNYNEIVFTNAEKDKIIDLYLNHKMSSVKIGELYNCDHKVILKVLHNNNVMVDQKKFVRHYSLNEHYFDIIDDQNKAYILGLLYADGSNDTSKSTISISLQEEDVSILEKIRVIVGSSKPLEYIDYSNKNDYGYKYKNQYRLIFFSRYMSNILENIGMISNKSLKLEFPNIDKKYYKHFIRGYFDGDGSLVQQIKNNNNHPVLVTITSTDCFCKKILDIINHELNINGCITEASCKNGITKVLSISGRNACKKFLDWIYTDANLYIKRKYNRYLDYYNINNSLLD